VSRQASRRAVLVAALVLGLASGGCRRKHVPVESSPELGYPACSTGSDAGTSDAGLAGLVVAHGDLRAGPDAPDRNVAERFELTRTPCGYLFTSRQEWPLAIADVEVHYDASLSPIWAWKRLTLAGSTRPDGNADIRRYEMRTGEVFIKRRDPEGEVTLQKLLPGGRMAAPAGSRVGAVVTPGRGGITPWLKRAHLPQGGKTQDLVLNFRDPVEVLEVGTLERQPDQFQPDMNRTVRVYTFFGKETVFADDSDVVIGDLSGMRPTATVTLPPLPPLPTYGGPDPQHTP
jgi:hypothetical protein